MPRFSVIVPVYKVQAYLRACLESVLTQTYGDFELIVVDDRSPDGSGEIADAVAAGDCRVTVLHLPENVGLGRARNAGMARATGDYLLFLDSDDLMTAGTLQAVAARLAETGDPDLLVFDYERTYWDGRAERNDFAAILTRAGSGVFTLDDHPEMLRLIMVAWNKAYRRDFVTKLPLAFPSGWYEDTPWTYPALLAARSIAVLDRVCVHYRQRRRGSILRTTSRRHFDVFGQYDLLFAFLDSHPELERWRPVLFRRMLDHLTTIFGYPDRVPRRSRADFFRRCRARYRTLRPQGFRPAPVSRSGVRYLLVALGARRTFEALGALQKLRPVAARRARAWRGTLRTALLHAHYLMQRRRPLDPDLAVYCAYWDRGYVCNPAAIEAAVRELAPHMRAAWITTAEHAHTLPPGVTRLEPESAAYWTALARATYLVSNVNLHRRYAKRPGQIHVQTHHGTPLKHMGIDLMDRPAAAGTTDFAKLLRHVDRWDFSLSASRHSTLVWERAYPSAFTTLEYGQPRTDVFHRADAERVAALRAALGIPAGATALLYAPTHRDYRRGYVPDLDLAALAGELGPDVVLLHRAHHRYPPGHAAPDHPRVLDVSAHPSAEELCLASDGLITDYSSLMFDYAGLDRPILLHLPDWEVYRATRGVYFDITEHPPGLVARGQDDLTDILATGAWRGPRSAQLRAAFRERFCAYDDGHAAERVVRRVFLREDAGLPAVVPMALRRPAPAPGALPPAGDRTPSAPGAAAPKN
ncbi:bifunctional glycosyltransferase/CDP-glycerol:glycerophosphate glycerophosphotransferase [Actinacidiphila acididurans]|uniref:Bifunctional glycosyltransferase family 2 protein/CDP-glycerol:glycerophosphate glycerophosphotransferase n=1 Tax=Actinacidiphila acididurans TaxID=2784346 RepID=A0ABS2TZT8_9ACTN|nr:bifunctional glycosyltransferase/CDP-glycerol:glycerophosphate glycerophosphotransferase [Actinacidiphila acididurans]MBM9508862.1 bifunctional glycosyltransferase family 2 protein/CDP-glycerol:glycerophosphate glycerophosphotransferase [Actinacidiphila acididurans]